MLFLRRLIALIIIFLVVEVGSVIAATFNVNSTEQDVDVNPGDGICATISGNCTLRAAIQEHNAIAGTNTLLLPPNTYLLLFAPNPTVYRGNLTIIGGGASSTIIDAGGFDYAFGISSASVSLTGVTIRNGGNSGLFVWADASLVLTECIVSDNTGAVGGGINNIGSVTISNSSIIRNTATVGGGIANSGILSISNSTISYNTAKYGGGIADVFTVFSTGSSAGKATLTNVTISGNTASDSGGGIQSAGGGEWPATLDLMNCTISNNSASNGGGLFSAVGTVALKNSIIANNVQGSNCGGDALTSSEGYNISSDNTCNLGKAGDKVGIDPRLGPLADNGGTTLTQALLEGSPAIDAATPSDYPSADQRGIARPQGAGPDIGAYEFVKPASVPTITDLGMLIFMVIAGFVSVNYLKSSKKRRVD